MFNDIILVRYVRLATPNLEIVMPVTWIGAMVQKHGKVEMCIAEILKAF